MTDELDGAALISYTENPETLLDDIDVGLESLSVEELPLSVQSGSEKPKERYRSVTNGRPYHAVFNSLLERSATQIRTTICVKCGYCELKLKHADTISLIKAVGDGWLSISVMFPLPVATIAAYCVQSLFLDRICDCASRARPNPDHQSVL